MICCIVAPYVTHGEVASKAGSTIYTAVPHLLVAIGTELLVAHGSGHAQHVNHGPYVQYSQRRACGETHLGFKERCEEEARARSYLSSRRPVLLGMHACCATESIIVAALDAGLPCAVVPCCGEPPTHARISITLVGLSFAHPDRRVPLCSSARGTWRLCCVCRTSAGQRRRTTAQGRLGASLSGRIRRVYLRALALAG